MPILAAIGAILLIFIVLWDAFETIILPRRVTRRVRITRVVYRLTWAPWSARARHIRDTGRRELFLSFYGPLALIFLLSVWVVFLILGFAIIQWSLGSTLITPIGAGHAGFGTDLYMSGTTFFTLGLGDVVPDTPLARLVTVAEAGTGFGILALVIGYLPVLIKPFRAARPTSPCWMRALARHPARANCCAATATATNPKPSASSSASGSAGQRNCWKAISPIPRSATSAPSTTTNPGSPRSPVCWIPAP